MSKRIKRGSAMVLAALMLLLLLPLKPQAADETRYDVRYRDGAGEDGPFGCVDASELRRLLAADALEWYEEDWELSLPDALPDGAAEPADVVLLADAPDTSWALNLIGAPRDAALGAGVRVAAASAARSAMP